MRYCLACRLRLNALEVWGPANAIHGKPSEQDYLHMVNDGLLPDEAENFDALMKRCADLEKRANA